MIQEKGLVDSFRRMHPNPLNTPGYTWPAGRPFVKKSIDGFNPSQRDLSERIDFIYTGGASKVLESHLVGEPVCKDVDIGIFPWPSDHRAVISTFEVTPVSLPMQGLSPIKATKHAQARLFLSKKTARVGESFTVRWFNSPGNGYDYIRITPVGTQHLGWGEAVRLYTHGEASGSIQYNATNVKGNWLAWNTAETGKWPLKPGLYDIKLMMDDGSVELAGTQIKIK
jgi:hypothetical protein